jgi:hypothetical protein
MLAQWGDSLSGDSTAKEIHGDGCENTLLGVDLETIFASRISKN